MQLKDDRFRSKMRFTEAVLDQNRSVIQTVNDELQKLLDNEMRHEQQQKVVPPVAAVVPPTAPVSWLRSWWRPT